MNNVDTRTKILHMPVSKTTELGETIQSIAKKEVNADFIARLRQIAKVMSENGLDAAEAYEGPDTWGFPLECSICPTMVIKEGRAHYELYPANSRYTAKTGTICIEELASKFESDTIDLHF
jgi:hypothetical protein